MVDGDTVQRKEAEISDEVSVFVERDTLCDRFHLASFAAAFDANAHDLPPCSVCDKEPTVAIRYAVRAQRRKTGNRRYSAESLGE